MSVKNQIQIRRGTSSEWAAINDGDGPILASGEPGFNSELNLLKIGDGSNYWKDLNPIGSDKSWYKVKNGSVGTIYAGQVVAASGTVGNSDAIVVVPFIANDSIDEITLMGCAVENMAPNDFGYVAHFGIIKGIDTKPDGSATNICAAGETWVDGDILYASPSVSGKLTKVKPAHETIVAIVLNSADNGSLFVRPTWYPHLDDLHNVDSSGATNNQYLIYNSGTQLWSPTSSGIFTSLDVRGPAVFNEDGGNNDFRIEGDTDANLFFVDASTDKIGIGTTSPGSKLSIQNSATGIYAGTHTTAGDYGLDIYNSQTSVDGSYASLNFRTGNTSGGVATGSVNLISTGYGAGALGFVTRHNATSSEKVRISSDGNVGIGTTSPSYKLQVNGSFGATTKSFRIDHPSRPNYTLEYGSLESPYHGVRLTGRGKVVKGVCVVDLPPYLKDLIHDDENINIQLTNYKHGKTLYVGDIDLNNSQFIVKCDRAKTLPDLEFFWTFTGVRKDVPSLVVEQEK